MAYSACFHDNLRYEHYLVPDAMHLAIIQRKTKKLQHSTHFGKGVKNPNEKVYEVFLQLAKVFCTRQNAHTVCNGMLLVSEKTTSGDFLSTATTEKKIGCNHVLVSYFLFCNELQSTCTEYYSLE